jgi:hypothetical protein
VSGKKLVPLYEIEDLPEDVYDKLMMVLLYWSKIGKK